MQRGTNYLIILVLTLAFSTFSQLNIKNSSNLTIITATQDGRIGIGTTNPICLLDCDGAKYYATFWGIPSYVNSIFKTNNEGGGTVVERALVASVPYASTLNTSIFRKAVTAVVWNEDDNYYIASGSLGSDEYYGNQRTFVGVGGFIGLNPPTLPNNAATYAARFKNFRSENNAYTLYVEGAKSEFATQVYMTSLPTGSGTPLQLDANNQIVRNTSSKRYKQNIRPLQTQFNKIYMLEPKRFTYIDSKQEDIGYLAEELDALGLKELVVYQDGNPEAIRYDKLSIYLVEVIKSLKKEVEELKAQINVNRNDIR